MIKLMFVGFSVVTNNNMKDAIEIDYFFTIKDKEREIKNSVRLSMAGNLGVEYGVQLWQDPTSGYYDKFAVEMFPYVIDKVKENPYGENLLIKFSRDIRPNNYKSVRGNLITIGGYEIEIVS